MAIKAGTVADFSGSLALAMEDALKAEYAVLKGEALPDQMLEDRRLMLVAIAQGMVRYLKSNANAFVITVETTLINAADATGTATVVDIDTSGTLY